jgi:DedD protein
MPPSLSSHEQLIQLRKRARRRLVGAIALVSVATVVLWNVVGHVPDQKLKPQSINIVELNSSAPAGEPVGKAASQAAAAVAAASAAQTDLPAALPEEGTPPPSQVAPSVAAAVAAAKSEQPVPPQAKPEKKAEPAKLAEAPKSKPKAEDKPKVAEDKPKPKKADPAAILAGRMGEDDAPQVKVEKQAVEPAKSGKVMIQLAALSDPDKVEALRNKLNSVSGLSAHYSFSKVQTSKGEVTRVRLGPFASADEAQATLAKLAKAGVSGIVVSH